MKINFLAPLKSLGGDDLKDGKGETFALRDAAVIALDSVTDADRKLEGKEKYRRGALAARIYGAKEAIALNLEERQLVKELIGKSFGPRVVKEAWDMLDPIDGDDGDDAPKEPKLAIPGAK